MRAACSVTVQPCGVLKVSGPAAGRDMPPARNEIWISWPPVVPQLISARHKRAVFFISALPLQIDLEREEDDAWRSRGEMRGRCERRIVSAVEVRGVEELAQGEFVVGEVDHVHAGLDRPRAKAERSIDLQRRARELAEGERALSDVLERKPGFSHESLLEEVPV